ncbi:MAG: thiamine-phosphate kinase [Candidatus Omnitrophica bacterium]|nr:thiamine-phosphate kinase [Candidatus Omnitrophota bacterium]
MRSLRKLGEFGLIDAIKKSVPVKKEVVKGIGDDAAILPLDKKRNFLLTTDMLVEGVHFGLKDSRNLVGRKALAVSISDIAAMGGVPKFAVVSLGVSKKMRAQEVKDIYKGLSEIAKIFDVSIVGGDTVQSDKLIINIALTGEARKKDIILRSGAKPGDVIFVTGVLGRSLKTKKHLNFIPRFQYSQYLVKKFKPSAMIDVSDGLSSDLKHILSESNVGAVIDEERIPCAKGATSAQALCDGEDFELVFTLTKKKAEVFKRQKKVTFYEIGVIVHERNGFMLRSRDGKLCRIAKEGYRHF